MREKAGTLLVEVHGPVVPMGSGAGPAATPAEISLHPDISSSGYPDIPSPAMVHGSPGPCLHCSGLTIPTEGAHYHPYHHNLSCWNDKGGLLQFDFILLSRLFVLSLYCFAPLWHIPFST